MFSETLILVKFIRIIDKTTGINFIPQHWMWHPITQIIAHYLLWEDLFHSSLMAQKISLISNRNRVRNCSFSHFSWHHQWVKCIYLATSRNTKQVQKVYFACAEIIPRTVWSWHWRSEPRVGIISTNGPLRSRVRWSHLQIK